MNKTNIFLTAILISILMLSACGQRSLQNEMISLDQVYIPALFITEAGSGEAAKKAIKTLREGWENFSIKYYNFRPQDPSWKQTFDLVDQRIFSADKIARSGKDLGLAHQELLGVKDLLFKMRRKNNIKYYVDYLIEFNQPLEAIILLTKDKDPSQLRAEDIKNLKWLVEREVSLWNKIAKSEFNSALFGFDWHKSSLMRKYIIAETEILQKLKRAVNEGDFTYINLSSDDLLANYINLYRLFGDFEGIDAR
jgi:hypothetical protein